MSEIFNFSQQYWWRFSSCGM